MRKTNHNLILLSMLFTVGLVISNVVTAKLFSTGLSIFHIPVTLPGAVLCYAITFLSTDVIGEIWGKQEANQTVRFGFLAQLLATSLIVLTQHIPAADAPVQAAYEILLGQNWVFFIGSMVAYLCSQTWDVWIFHNIRDRFQADQRKRWVWNNASTMTSQIIDTVLFVGLSFGIGLGWAFDPGKRMMLIAMMIGQYAFKAALALLDTPIFYLLTRKKNA